MRKQTIRLNEAQLNRIIKESVKKVLKEYKNKDTERFNTTGKKRGSEELDKRNKRIDNNNLFDGNRNYLYHNSTAAKGLARLGQKQLPNIDSGWSHEMSYGDFEDDQWLHDHPVSQYGYLDKRDTIPTFDNELMYGDEDD